ELDVEAGADVGDLDDVVLKIGASEGGGEERGGDDEEGLHGCWMMWNSRRRGGGRDKRRRTSSFDPSKDRNHPRWVEVFPVSKYLFRNRLSSDLFSKLAFETQTSRLLVLQRHVTVITACIENVPESLKWRETAEAKNQCADEEATAFV
uniref:SAC domain-containing protein n=1 Tax=Steinernema glaseri TaxID=37863 RepID=A0A1I7YYU2_9BILA